MNPGVPQDRPRRTDPSKRSTSSVLFAHYLLAHNLGGHDGPADDDRREMIYYRLHATGHRTRWRDAVTNPSPNSVSLNRCGFA
jgi:hypothetical protein